jgi:hypothetical protein
MMRGVLGSVFIAICSMMAFGGEEAPKPVFEPHLERSQANLDYFEEHLAKCPEKEIRCLWFLRGDPGIGMVMTLDLQAGSVYTVREVYDWAMQTSESRKLSDSQNYWASKLRASLPAGEEKVEFGKGLHIAFWKDGKLQRVTYDRSAVPLIVQRLYDIGGGASEFTYKEVKPDAKKAEKDAPSGGDKPVK